MTKKLIPTWPADTILSPGSAPFKAMQARLTALVTLLDRTDAVKAPGDFLKLAEAARTLIRTMLTACDAQRALNARGSRAGGVRQQLLGLAEELDRKTECLDIPVSDDPLVKAFFRWKAVQARRRQQTPAERRVAEPLRSLYSRLKAGMRINVPTTGGAFSGTLTAAAAESVLKNTDDPAVRRSAFGVFNAWYAENAPLFADLLNAVTAVRVNALETSGRTLTDAAAADEGVSAAVMTALLQVVDDEAPLVRPAVSMQAEVFVGKGAEPKMPMAFLWAPPPFAKTPAPLTTFEGAVKAVKASLETIAPTAAAFIDREMREGWVEGRNLSGGEGGSWTDELPATGAVAVYADWQPTVGRAFELAHTFGEAFVRSELLKEPTLVRRPPAVICETVGRLFSHALLVYLIRETEAIKADYAAVLWQGLKRLTKNLLDLPFRCRLTQSVHEERARRYLAVSDLNELTEKAWKRFYGDSTDGYDQFVWAHRVHFYRTETLHYDWQYTFGFLASVKLYERLAKDGTTASGGTLADFCRESAWTDGEALFKKHLGADLTDERFWQDAYRAALFPLRLAEEL